jgi:hypothetical protein
MPRTRHVHAGQEGGVMLDEPKQKMTWWDLGRALQDIGNALKDYPLSILKEADEEATKNMERLEERIRWTIHSIRGYEMRLAEVEEEAFDRIDNVYRKVSKKRDEIQRRIKELPDLSLPDFYKIKEMISVMESLSRLPDHSWVRMVEMMTLLGKKEE